MLENTKTRWRRRTAAGRSRARARAAGLIVCGSLAAVTAAAAPAPETVVGATLRTFKLSDQFEKEQVVAFPHDRPTVLCIADRKSSSQIGAWTRRIHKELPAPRCRVVGLAVLKGVPFFLRGMVRGFFQKSGGVLMDWGGKVGTEAGARAGACTVVLVDGGGVIRHVVHGPFEEGPFAELMAAFAALDTGTGAPEPVVAP